MIGANGSDVARVKRGDVWDGEGHPPVASQALSVAGSPS